MNLYRFLLVATLIALPLSVGAATFVAPEGESASVRSEVIGDVYAASNAVVVAAPVRGDIFAAGDSVDVSGPSDASIFAVGRSITVSADVKDDIRVAGSAISLTSSIAHDVFAGGSSVSLGPDSSIGGDAYLAGSDITVAGRITGRAYVAGERVTIAKTARIGGDVVAYGIAPVIEDGAKISGIVRVVAQDMGKKADARQDRMSQLIRSAVSRAVLAIILLWIAPLLVPALMTRAQAALLQSGLWGLLIVVLFLPAVFLLAVTGIGIHTAAFVFTLCLLVLALGSAVATLLLGSWLMKLFTKQDTALTWQHAVVGAVAAGLISLLGGIGMLILFIIFLIGVGASAMAIKHLVYGS